MLQWNVFYFNINRKRIETYNVFNHYSFKNEVDAIVKNIEDREIFKEKIHKSLAYYFRCRAEWEIILNSWPYNTAVKDKKIDVYNQVILNFDRFIDYIWKETKE